jgi:hypothetical protein
VQLGFGHAHERGQIMEHIRRIEALEPWPVQREHGVPNERVDLDPTHLRIRAREHLKPGLQARELIGGAATQLDQRAITLDRSSRGTCAQ